MDGWAKSRGNPVQVDVALVACKQHLLGKVLQIQFKRNSGSAPLPVVTQSRQTRRIEETVHTTLWDL